MEQSCVFDKDPLLYMPSVQRQKLLFACVVWFTFMYFFWKLGDPFPILSPKHGRYHEHLAFMLKHWDWSNCRLLGTAGWLTHLRHCFSEWMVFHGQESSLDHASADFGWLAALHRDSELVSTREGEFSVSQDASISSFTKDPTLAE